MTNIEQRFYGIITKKNLLWKTNMVKERFNNANFKAKRSGGKQVINRVEVVSLSDMIQENERRGYNYV